MKTEQIGIIYPDPARIPEIKDWLKPYSSLSHAISFTGLAQAVPILSKFSCDLLIVADAFPEAQGAILLKGLRRLCPGAQFLMLASGRLPNEELTAIAHEDFNVQYFPQPWDIQGLLAHIEAGIGKETPSFVTALTFDDDRAQDISNTLGSLMDDTAALSAYLVTELGQVLDYKGSELSEISEVSSLLGGSFAALRQLGATLEERGEATNLIHRQGQTEDLYALSVGNEALLVLRFAVGPTAPRIGTVAFYARHAVEKLAAIITDQHNKPTQPFASEDVESALKTELDNLFEDTESEQSTKSRLLTFTRALKEGLVSKSLINRWDRNQSLTSDEASGEAK
jgi:hypothetical protein